MAEFLLYCQNLNLIEEFWKFFKRHVLYKHCYGMFDQFKCACKELFAALNQFAPGVGILFTEHFQTIGETGSNTLYWLDI